MDCATWSVAEAAGSYGIGREVSWPEMGVYLSESAVTTECNVNYFV